MLNRAMNSFRFAFIFHFICVFLVIVNVTYAQTNQPPEFLPGGDMYRFSIREDTPKGASVYTLKAIDPEESDIVYSVSSDYLTIDSKSGVITLATELDRESEDLIQVNVSATDQPFFGQPPNTVTLAREITILDQNDNPPVFQNLPYITSVAETTPVEVELYRDIIVTDADIGSNAEIVLSCDLDLTPAACQKFFVKTEKIESGKYRGIIILQEPLDFETTSIYLLAIKAEDQGIGKRHVSSAIVVAEVIDEQDQGPQFQNSSYSVSVEEESIEKKEIVTINVNDGDRGNPRPLYITLLDDTLKFFEISRLTNDSLGNYFVTISTTGKPIDREDTNVLWNGGYYIFKIKAIEMEKGQPNDILAIAEIRVEIIDINDNQPTFDKSNISVDVAENISSGFPVPGLNFNVFDLDEGSNAEFSLSIESEQKEISELFEIEPKFGQKSSPVTVLLKNDAGLDYERLEMRELSFAVIASHSSSQTSFVNVTVNVQDSNDNNPIFEKSEYVIHTLLKQTPNTTIIPVLATDKDAGQFGNIWYEFFGKPPEQFSLDSVNGSIYVYDCGAEICSLTPERHSLIIKAKDSGGKFALASVVIFVDPMTMEKTGENTTSNVTEKITFTNSVYNSTIREITKEGTVVARLDATSDDADKQIYYSIINGSRGNFVVSSLEGIITVAPGAVLDIDLSGVSSYNMTVQASFIEDNDVIAFTQVYILIEDVNNKAPKFENEIYIVRVSEETAVGEEVFSLTATDTDSNADLKYSFGKLIAIHDQLGNVSSNPMTLNEIFQLNSSTGVLLLNTRLAHEEYLMINFVVNVEDLAAQTAGQSDLAEIVMIITGSSSVFSPSWKIPKPFVELTIPEEMQVGSQVLVLGGTSVSFADVMFNKIEETDPNDYFSVESISGSFNVKKPVDYEFLPEEKALSVQIEIKSQDRIVGRTTVNLTVLDINDNSPIFEQNNYNVTIVESDEDTTELLTLTASDKDSNEFGEIIYHLSDSSVFVIDEKLGILSKKSGLVLDREKMPFYNLKVIATDNPKNPDNQKSSTASVFIQILDANDNSPYFTGDPQTVLIPESTPEGSSILVLKAADSDYGINAELEYSIVNSRDAVDLFSIDSKTAVLSVNQSLSKRGRSLPYRVTVQAKDKGSPSLSANTDVTITIGDLAAQDEMPQFIHPRSGEVIYMAETEKEDLVVCQVELSEQDLYRNMKKVIKFSLLDQGYGGSSRRTFTIDSNTGLVTTRRPLDRETVEKYTLVIAATQIGPSMLQAYQIVNVTVTDIDDNAPYFPRPLNSEPLQMSVLEESEIGTTIGIIQAVDPDNEENSRMEYCILGQGDESSSLFGINASVHDDLAVIYVKGRLDHEQKTKYDLLIRVRSSNDDVDEKNAEKNVTYNPQDLSQLRVRVELIDIDDNPIQFMSPMENLGVRLNAPRQSIVTTVQAYDPDASDNPLQYFIEKVVFVKDNNDQSTLNGEAFFLEKDTGVLRTAQSLIQYEDGTFHLSISSKSARKPDSFQETQMKIKVLQDADMLKFVFLKSPSEVQMELRNINRDFQTLADLPQPVILQLADAQLNVKDDSFINDDSTSLCFQLVKDKLPFELSEAQALLDSHEKPSLREFYQTYNISNITPCEQVQPSYRMNWIEIFVLVIAAFVGLISVIAIAIMCCLQQDSEEMSKTQSRYNNNSK